MSIEVAVEKAISLRLFLWENRKVVFLWLYLSGLCAAETVTGLVSLPAGVLLHIIIFFSLLLHAALYYKYDISKLYLSLCLAPLIRIMSLAMPLFKIPVIYWYLIIGVPLLAAAFSLMKILELKPKEVGLRIGNTPLQGMIIFLGIPLGLLEYIILKPKPLIEVLNWQSVLFPALILLIFTGFLEEFIFRGILYKISVETVGKNFGLFYISMLFAVLHITHLSAVDVLFVFLVALIFSWLMDHFKSLLGISLAHGITNIGLYLVWPFLIGNHFPIF